MEARGEEINASSSPSKEIAGLKKMKMITPGSQNSCVWNSRMKRSRYVGALWAYVGTYGPLECSGEFLSHPSRFWLSFKPFCTRIT